MKNPMKSIGTSIAVAMGGGPRVSSGKGTSKQDYKTPRDFLGKVEGRFGPIRFDLAADASNCVVEGDSRVKRFYSAEDSAFAHDWNTDIGSMGMGLDALLWLNPPFDNITPFAKKCADTMRLAEEKHPTRIALLVPASVGSNWFRDYVWEKALVLFLNGRICFDGKNPYPKDCLLAVYAARPAIRYPSSTRLVGAEVWPWKA